MLLGLEKLLTDRKVLLKNKRVGLLAHRASVDSSGRHIIDLMRGVGVNVTAIFGPEHGFDTSLQDMESVPNKVDTIPIYSLYGKTFDSLKPTSKMFSEIDCLVVDLQDIGSRYYTYIYTMALSMQTAAATKTKVVVCDRPNPINGVDVEGRPVKKGYESFVGLYPIPNRHGMTVGELARLFNDKFGIGCDLEVVEMDGWKREWYWDETGLKWINPSPNMRSLNAALLYPGMCLLEGTNISEGRGTDTPFEQCGAPFVNTVEAISRLDDLNLPGIKFHETTFIPSRQKWSDEECNGLRFEVTDREKFRPYETGLALIYTLASQKGFQWRREEYEFCSDLPAIDLLTGSSYFRKVVDDKAPFGEIKKILL